MLRVPSTASGYDAPGYDPPGFQHASEGESALRAERRLTPLESDFSEDVPSRKPDLAWRDSHGTRPDKRKAMLPSEVVDMRFHPHDCRLVPACSAISSGQVFIMNTIPNRELESFHQK